MRSLFVISFTIHFFLVVAVTPAFSQAVAPGTDSAAMAAAMKVYHHYMSPETGLYNGSEYPYDSYYPMRLADSDPFFMSALFDTGSVVYNGLRYDSVPLLYDVIQQEVLIRDPVKSAILRLHNENVEWFRLYGHTFYRTVRDSIAVHPVSTGFYTPLYAGNTSLYMYASKLIKQSSSSFSGLRDYADDNNEFYIKKGKDFFRVKDKKSVLKVLSDKRKEVAQYISRNKLKLRRSAYTALPKIVAYYDGL